MKKQFNTIKKYLIELGYEISYENESQGLLRIDKETDGIKNMILGCAPPILIMEQFILKLKNPDVKTYKALLQKNRDIVHGAFVIDETGTGVIFRDTLQIDNLDINELEGSLNSLSLLLSEFSEQIIEFSKL